MNKGSIIPTVVLPTTEIIELLFYHLLRKSYHLPKRGRFAIVHLLG